MTTATKKKAARRVKKQEEAMPKKPPSYDEAVSPPADGAEIASRNRGEVTHKEEPDVNLRHESFPQDLKNDDDKYPAHEFVKDWPGRDVFIAFPCHKQTNAATTWALCASAQDLGKEKGQMDIAMGDGVIFNARNRLAHRFLASGAEWLIWVDDDMIPPIGRPEWFRWIGNNNIPNELAGQHYIGKLKSRNQTLVGACYFGRQITGLPVFNQGRIDQGAFNAAKNPVDRIIPTEWTGTGCMLVHRSVFEDIKIKFPKLAPTNQYPFWNFFHHELGWGEDVSFCMRAKEAGHQPYTDIAVQCLHVGYCAWGFHNTEGKLGQSSTEMV